MEDSMGLFDWENLETPCWKSFTPLDASLKFSNCCHLLGPDSPITSVRENRKLFKFFILDLLKRRDRQKVTPWISLGLFVW